MIQKHKTKTNDIQKGYKKLLVYQKAKLFVLKIYEITVNFPSSEIYVMVPQMRRAAMSILANIVEGYSKDSSKEFSRFLTISIGSASEVEVFLEISFELQYIKGSVYNETSDLLEETKRLLYSMRKAVRERF